MKARKRKQLHSFGLQGIIVVLTCLYLLAFALNMSPYLRGPDDWRWAYAIPGFPIRHLLPILTVGVYIVGVVRWGVTQVSDRGGNGKVFLVFVALAVPVIQGTLLFPESPDVLRPLFYRTVSAGASGVFSVGSTIEHLGSFLPAYPRLMPTFPVHPQRYPPGLPLLFYLARRVFETLPARLSDRLGLALRRYQCHDLSLMRLSNATLATAAVQMALPVLSGLIVFPLYGLAKRSVGQRAALWSAALYPLVPSFALWAGRWDQFYPLLTCTAWYLFHRGLTSSNRTYLLGAGLVLSITSFLSFGPVVILMPMGITALLWLWSDQGKDVNYKKQRLIDAGIFFAGCVLPWLVYQVIFGVGFLDIWRVSMSFHLGLDRNYWTWLVFHLYDFFAFLGFPLLVGFVLGVGSAVHMLVAPHSFSRRSEAALPLGFTLGLLGLNISGTARGEVARVWLFLTPFAVITAAYGLTHFFQTRAVNVSGRRFMVIVGLLALQLLVFNAFLRVVTTGLTDPPARPHHSTIPHLDHSLRPQKVQLGDAVSLAGYTLHPQIPQPSDTLTLTLVWQARAPMTRSYTVFTHLMGPTDAKEPLTQQDNMPIRNQAPTTCWIPGEIITDPYTLVLPSDAPAGRYTLYTGMYVWETGERLPAQGPNVTPDNRVKLTTFQIEGQ